MFTSLPFWQAAIHAQNTFFSLLVLAITVTFWRSSRPFLAGLTAGLLLFKPQIGAIIAIVLIASQGRRAALGFGVTAAALLLITLIVLPGALGDYLSRLPANLRAIQILPNYTWHRHVTFLAWWRILLQGHVGALPTILTQILAYCCNLFVTIAQAITVWRNRNDPSRADLLIAATIVSMPLLMPYYMDYDLCLLSVAAVLCIGKFDRNVFRSWATVYCASEVNAGIAGATRVIPIVPLLTVLSLVLIVRANRIVSNELADGPEAEHASPLALAA